MLPSPLAIIDLETTGTDATRDRVTEIGIVRVVDGAVVEEWSSLVNPGTPIPAEIQALTGITDAMVRDAPTFASLQGEILQRLEGHLFVAHNARFDYGFIKNEMRRLGLRYTADVLCTVRLSRRLQPEHAHHSLDALVERHGLDAAGRHRALGDARLAWTFLARMAGEYSQDIAAHVKALLKIPSLPPQLPADALAGLPEGPGVYAFYGVNDLPLYIGKSINLRERVRAHFSSDHMNANDHRLALEIRRIDFEEAAGELGALLRESQFIKRATPLSNRALRRNEQLVFLRVRDLARSPEFVKLADFDLDDTEGLYGPFASRPGARALLSRLGTEHGLCWRALGVQRGDGACFARQLKRCRGACVGEESVAQHHLRLIPALSAYRFPAWPHAGPAVLREVHPEQGWAQYHVLDRWCHLGSARDPDALPALLSQPRVFDADVFRLLVKRLGRSGHEVMPMQRVIQNARDEVTAS